VRRRRRGQAYPPYPVHKRYSSYGDDIQAGGIRNQGALIRRFVIWGARRWALRHWDLCRDRGPGRSALSVFEADYRDQELRLSTEAELVGLSDSANQGLFLRNFLCLQGYSMPAVIVYQDNLWCGAACEGAIRGRAHSAHRHMLFLDEIPRGYRRGRNSAQGDLGTVRQRAH
jgi:hypothetical protein